MLGHRDVGAEDTAGAGDEWVLHACLLSCVGPVRLRRGRLRWAGLACAGGPAAADGSPPPATMP